MNHTYQKKQYLELAVDFGNRWLQGSGSSFDFSTFFATLMDLFNDGPCASNDLVINKGFAEKYEKKKRGEELSARKTPFVS